MTWLELDRDASFGLDTLPYGVFRRDGLPARVGVRIGDDVLDLATVSAALDHPNADVFEEASLNPLMALGPSAWSEIRAWIASLFEDESNRAVVVGNLIGLADVTLDLPIEVADYVDFYASERHARNVGAIFRPDSPDLPPNWKHLPIGYHGRSGTVVVSGTEITRPSGQRRPTPDTPPIFGPTVRLDIECEVGFIVGQASSLGVGVDVGEAERHIFGVVLLNDWSARDIQAWEYVPLGPFLGKSFATSISAWVVPWEALAAARVAGPAQEPAVLAYLEQAPEQLRSLEIHLEIAINDEVVSQPEFRDMYWSPAQMLAHMTVNGASLRVGDVFGSGTVSGDQPETFGSLLELTWNATTPINLADGSSRGFLEDGDIVTIRGWAPGPGGGRVTFGEVSGTVIGREA